MTTLRTLCALGLAVALAGCAALRRPAIASQPPGAATGAGATLTGPANAAAPTTQRAERTIYYAPDVPAPVASATVAAPAPADLGRISAPAVAPISPPVPAAPRPAYVHETVETTIGQHQDAAGILRAAEAASRWTWLRWVGVVCILSGVAGWLWSVGNPLGYPLVFIGVAGCGVVFLLASANPAWLLVLFLPVGFYAAQKLGILKPARP